MASMDIVEHEAKEDKGDQNFPPTEHLRKCLLDQSQAMGKRTRAAFFLRTLGTPPAVEAVCEGLCEGHKAVQIWTFSVQKHWA